MRQQPSGPPLLDTNEHDVLQNFFEDPTNIDPHFAINQASFTGEADLYGNNTNSWMFGGASDFPNSSTNMSESSNLQNVGRDLQAAAFASFPPTPAPNGQVTAEADYDVARILHDSQNVRVNAHGNQQSGFNASPYATSQNRHAQAPDPTYKYPQNPAFSNTYYPYSHDGSANFFATAPVANMPGTGQRPSQQYAGQLQRSEWPDGLPQGTLKFGSDDKFRNSSYAGSTNEGPDRDLKGMIAHNFVPDEGYTSNQNTRPTSPNSDNRKRRRQPRMSRTPESVLSDQDDAETDDRQSHKRRRSKYRDEDGDYEEQGTSRAKGKGARSSLGKETSNTESPGRRRKSPALSSRDIQESRTSGARENLMEEQKRSNHIQSERKRRNLIKQGFEDINRMVPELRSGGFSKSNMLLEAAKFMRQLRDGNEELKRRFGAVQQS
ncbi:MAG: hypothetical protein M1828_005686 [Chrysothrix sp. TS-e1954]|nr:MAG: hypothetical protein M1828_005686 [Chrysothrix sp. TS-e1954]